HPRLPLRPSASGRHAEVFLFGSVEPPIIERPRPLPGNDAPTRPTPSSAKSPQYVNAFVHHIRARYRRGCPIRCWRTCHRPAARRC
ncbi:hypothetical protein DSI46_20455, partial [Mycobacterium tuberculosis]